MMPRSPCLASSAKSRRKWDPELNNAFKQNETTDRDRYVGLPAECKTIEGRDVATVDDPNAPLSGRSVALLNAPR
jgi:hypothetical protein